MIPEPNNAPVLCQCGCGQFTEMASKTNKKYGWVKGQPLRFIHGHNPTKPNIEERLWSNMDKTGECWLWVGKRTKAGYGVLSVRGQEQYTHRLAWEFTNGLIPEGMDVLHHCDNPPCGRPAHLFPGTAVDNSRDMYAKGRGTPPPHYTGDAHPFRRRPELVRRGERHPKVKLTEEDVLRIRKEHAQGASYEQLASRYGVDKSNIGYIVSGKTWRHLLPAGDMGSRVPDRDS